MMLLYPVHAILVAQTMGQWALRNAGSQFDLRSMAILHTPYGWLGVWGTAFALVWLAVALGLWSYHAFRGRQLTSISLRPFIAVLTGLVVVACALASEVVVMAP